MMPTVLGCSQRWLVSATWKLHPYELGGASLGCKHYSGQPLFK
jgi:hypothetical protein